MRIENYQFPESSFLSLEKDYKIIISKILKNQRLLKYLKYPVKECLSAPDITPEEALKMLGKEIRIIPKLPVEKDINACMVINFNNFTLNDENPEFRDNTIQFDIFCNYDIYDLGDFKLRPVKIAGEVDAMFNKKHLTGIGTLEFISGNHIGFNPDMGGFTVKYLAIHGKEDKV